MAASSCRAAREKCLRQGRRSSEEGSKPRSPLRPSRRALRRRKCRADARAHATGSGLSTRVLGCDRATGGLAALAGLLGGNVTGDHNGCEQRVARLGRSVCDKAAGRRKKALSLGHRFARVDARCGGENAAQMPELMLRDRGCSTRRMVTPCALIRRMVSNTWFPEDARWNPERIAVEFGVEIGEYRGVVRVPRRVLQQLLGDTPTSERCVEALRYRARHGCHQGQLKSR
jgi:hypothetical protein